MNLLMRIVYGVIGMGFATRKTIFVCDGSVKGGGVATGWPCSGCSFAVPAHATFAVLMGHHGWAGAVWEQPVCCRADGCLLVFSGQYCFMEPHDGGAFWQRVPESGILPVRSAVAILWRCYFLMCCLKARLEAWIGKHRVLSAIARFAPALPPAFGRMKKIFPLIRDMSIWNVAANLFPFFQPDQISYMLNMMYKWTIHCKADERPAWVYYCGWWKWTGFCLLQPASEPGI